MPKLPAFQFYPGDWRKDPGVQSLSFHDRGVWFEIICLMHESENRGKLILNGKAMPQDALARLLGLDEQILSKTINNLLLYGVASLCENTAALMSRRMVTDESLRQRRIAWGTEGGVKGGLFGEQGKGFGIMGGRPRKDTLGNIAVNGVNNPPNNPPLIPPPSSSSSDLKSEDKEKSKREPLKRFQRPTISEISEYCQERKNKVSPEKFFCHYEANGWRVGKTSMKDWKAAIRTWELNEKDFSNKTNQPKKVLQTL